MGHYDSSRPGYCGGCGAGPGNIKAGKCEFCEQFNVRPTTGRTPTKPVDKRGGEGPYLTIGQMDFDKIEQRVFAAIEGPLKDHEIAMAVNTLTAIASEYGQTQQLRERIARFIVPLLRRVQ